MTNNCKFVRDIKKVDNLYDIVNFLMITIHCKFVQDIK